MIKRVASVQFNPWDDVYHFDCRDTEVRIGDKVVVKTETAIELGAVVGFSDVDDESLDSTLRPIVRRATADDIKKASLLEQKKNEVLMEARDQVQKRGLSMKLVDCYFSFDGGKLTFIFTADGRVDFRDLVKDLARMFQKSIRLQQVGIRDEAKRMGGFGNCGREVCCRKFLGQLSSIPTDYARIQQVHNRGSDRISGPCGRLMCCLAFEADMYQQALKEFPPLESSVKTKAGKGTVVSCNVIKRTVNVRIDSSISEFLLAEVRKL